MEKINFYLMQLIEETNTVDRFVNPSFESFLDFPTQTSILFEDVYYEISAEKYSEYLWIVFDFGKTNPRDDKVTNIKTGDKKDNQRNEDEAELLNQLFFLYNFNTHILYISNSRKQKIIKDLFKQKLEKNFIIQSFFKSDDEFISILKSITKISFTEASNLFNQNSKERKALIDLTGTDAPVQFTIETKYNKVSNITDFIKHLLNSKKEMSLKDLTICGIDNEDFNVVFNTDTFSRKIEIDCIKEDNGKFNIESVKSNLIKKISE